MWSKTDLVVVLVAVGFIAFFGADIWAAWHDAQTKTLFNQAAHAVTEALR